jgi:signal transduction histidine kinase
VLAPVLAGAGADVDWCERVAAAMGGAPLEAALEWVASTLASTGLLAEVKESTRRISDLVAAVKSYSQLDRASMQITDLAEGLESTLVMLAHRIPADVTVVRDYRADVPRIQALAAELNQVWTNLITNALDAMDGGGTLRVSTRVDRGSVVVEVADTGSGMSPETREHAFDPFYTTKGVGQGTGLGLDISRRIVERHSGDIGIDTRPGETVLRVRLPATGAPAGPR